MLKSMGSILSSICDIDEIFNNVVIVLVRYHNFYEDLKRLHLFKMFITKKMFTLVSTIYPKSLLHDINHSVYPIHVLFCLLLCLFYCSLE